MTEFEKVLQECLHDLEQGAANVEECLSRFPIYAAELEPILLTTAYLERARAVNISDPFRARVRSKLSQQMHVHPRKRARASFVFTYRAAAPARLAAGFAVILLALLAAGTAYAQSALPGEMFYAWKLRSETAWRAVSPDPVGTDLAIAERRVDELIAVSDYPVLYAQTLDAYMEVAERLKSEANTETQARILAALDSQSQELSQSGIVLPQLEEEVPPLFKEPTPIPPTTPTAVPLPVLETPQIEPTGLPQMVPTEPTLEVPPVEIPPVQELPKIVPTVQVPPVQDLPELIPTVKIPPVQDPLKILPTVEVPSVLP